MRRALRWHGGWGGKGGGTTDKTSAWPTDWLYVMLTYSNTTLDHLMPVLEVGVSGGWQGANRGVAGIGGLHMKNDILLQSTVENCRESIADNRTWCQMVDQLDPLFIPLLVTRCLYWGVHLTECQPDARDHQMSRWPNIVPFWATRYLYW